MNFATQRLLRTLLAVSLVATPAVAFAQVSQVPAPGLWGSYTHRNTVAFDPVSNVYMVIVWDPPFGPALTGRFIDKNGNVIGADFPLVDENDNGFASWASLSFGGPPNDPAFLVTYLVTMDGTFAIKYGRLIRFNGGAPTVSPRVVIADVGAEWFAAEKAQSYWNGQRFVVGTRLMLPGFSFPTFTASLVDMALNVSPSVNLGDGADFYGSPALACGNGVCLAVGFKAGIAGGYSGGTYGRLFDSATLVPQGTAVIPVNALGANEDQAVIYQKHTGMFLAEWFRVAGGYIDTRLVVPDGNLGATQTAAGPNGGMNTISYNQFTQTTLLTFKDSLATLYAYELGDNGLPIRPNNFLTLTAWDGAINDYLPSIAANEEDGQWLVAFRLAASSQGVLAQGTYVDPTQVPLAIQTSGTLPPATHTIPYAQLLLGSGGVIPYTWSLVSGTLPPGIFLNGPYLSGTPTLPGNYNFRLRVTSTDNQVAERDFAVSVQAIISVPPGGGGAHIDGLNPLYLAFSHGKRNNLAYDSVNGVYLMTVHEDGGVPVPFIGRFLDKNGNPVGFDFTIAEDTDPNTGELAIMSWSGITFGGPPNDPMFLVTYTVADVNQVNSKFARIVRYVPGGAPLVSGRTHIADVFTQWFASEKAQSIWLGDHWIIGTRVLPPGFSFPSFQVNRFDLPGTMSPPTNLGDGLDFYGSPAMSCAANGVCIVIGFKAGIPTGYSGGTYARRFNGNTLAPLGQVVTLFGGMQNEDQGVVYQTHTGHFLAQWWRGNGAGYIDTRLIGTDGSMSLLDLSRGIGPGAGANAIAFNEGTRTSLLVTKNSAAELIVMELGDDGYPLNPGNTVIITPWDGSINDFYPSIASNGTDRQWLVTARLASGTHGKIVQGAQTGTTYAVQNWSFSMGMTGWTQFGMPNPSDIVTTVNNGVLEFYRQPPPPGQTNQGVVLQSLGIGFPAGAPISAEFDIGNSSTVRKRISILLHDLNFSDLQVCSFWLDPGAPMRTYRIRTFTTRPWANATIAFYAATPGSDGGAYRLDNVEVYALPGQAIDRTECVDPTTPAPVGEPNGGTIIVNGDFESGLAPWGTFGQITSQVSGGVFQFARPAGTPAGVVLQITGVAQPNDTRLTATFSLGNSSGARRRVTVLIHDNDFSDLAACTFWLEPGMPLSTHQMKLFTTKPWVNATLSVYPANVDESQWILLDNVSLQTTPSAPLLGTECIGPPPSLLGAVATQAGSSATGASGAAAVSIPGYGDDQPLWRAIASESGTQAYLWRAPIDLREASHPRLRFESQLSDGTSDAFVEVTRDGVTWIRIAVVAPSDDWTSVTVDLSEFEGDIIYVRFVYRGAELAGGAPGESWAIRALGVDKRAPQTIRRFR